MIEKAELRANARAKLNDAQALFPTGRYDGAIYLCGYALELALKARICQTLKWLGFPDTRSEFENYQSFRTHNLEVLLHLSGIEDRVKLHYLVKWSVVKAWNPEIRNKRAGDTTQLETQTMLAAVRLLV